MSLLQLPILQYIELLQEREGERLCQINCQIINALFFGTFGTYLFTRQANDGD